jgi:uncharacterized protein (DUF2062 family)
VIPNDIDPKDVDSKDVDPLDAKCRRCLQAKPRYDLDRLLWCDACKEKAQARAVSQSWYVGLGVAAVLALWIWLYIQPSNLVIGGWIGTVIAAFYVTSRVAREILYAIERMRSLPTAGAAPPE